MGREKNNHENNSLHSDSRKSTKDDKYVDGNRETTDSDAAEANPRIKRASQLSDNDIEEGDEDYDDEKNK